MIRIDEEEIAAISLDIKLAVKQILDATATISTAAIRIGKLLGNDPDDSYLP